jgi:hypothetical protein
VSRGQRGGSPTVFNLSFLDRDTASVVPNSPILVTLMKEALSSSETSVLTRATRSHRRENLKSYTWLPITEVPLFRGISLSCEINLFYKRFL